MVNFFSIIIIILITIIIIILKRKYVLNFFYKKNLNLNNNLNIKNKQITSSEKFTDYYHKNGSNNYSGFYKRNLRKTMFNLYKGNPEDKLKALKIAEELADKSTLPIIKKGLKDMNSEVVKFSAVLIRKFK